MGGGAAVLAAFYYLKVKKDSAEALNENIDTKNKINELDKDASKNSGLLEAEEEKRKQLENEKNEKIKDTSLNTLIDFFNGRKK